MRMLFVPRRAGHELYQQCRSSFCQRSVVYITYLLAYLLICFLTPCSRVLLEKLVGPEELQDPAHLLDLELLQAQRTAAPFL